MALDPIMKRFGGNILGELPTALRDEPENAVPHVQKVMTVLPLRFGRDHFFQMLRERYFRRVPLHLWR